MAKEEFVSLRPLIRINLSLNRNTNVCFPGAALGRLLGEGVAHVSSTEDQQWASLNPGGYALAGKINK